MKCDIEINITADGKDNESMHVPQSLHAAATESSSSTQGQENSQTDSDKVSLPHRYVQIIGSQKNGQIHPNMDNDIDSREKDLGTALKWIKQEILQMKEQDKSLMKQFIDLRSTIVQLKYMHEFHSSNSDISSMSGSNVSLDEIYRTSSPPKHHHTYLSPNDFFDNSLEFRARTSSLLTPRRSPVTRIKWKSNEIL